MAVPQDRDAVEFTVMTYRSYVGGPSTGGYTYGQWDAPQTFMMLDIQALQTMYGADYSTNSGNTTYAWSTTTGQMFVNGVGQGTPGGNRVFLTIWDGGGIDTYDLSNYANNVSINLAPGGWSITSDTQRADLGAGQRANGTVYNSLLFAGNTASLIENAFGGSGNDNILGNTANNELRGNNGNDSLSGLEGNDVLIGGAGADRLDGGAGSDWAFYIDEASGVNVNLQTGATSGAALGDVLVSIENLMGSEFADNLTGDGNANQLRGAGGNDQLAGGSGDDSLFGGEGNDILFGGAGADRLEGDTGLDWASYLYDGSGVGINLLSGAASGAAAGDILVSIENLMGGQFADTLVGDNGANELHGAGGNDVLAGGGGDDSLFGGEGGDVLYGGAGADRFDGGAGSDWASYLYDSAAVVINLLTGAAGGAAQQDIFISIENLMGSQFGDDLTGDGNANELHGAGGADLLAGGGGADSLFGGEGGDILLGGTGADRLDGGAGNDWASYIGESSGATVYLHTGATGGSATGDLFFSIENLMGSQLDDILMGNAEANEIQAAGGNDFLLGGAGSDTLVGGEGNDQMDGGAGADRLEGGTGFDYVRYDDASTVTGVFVWLAANTGYSGNAAGDLLFGLEGVIGSGFADVIMGDGSANALWGQGGDDVLVGLEGNDSLYGGSGLDQLRGGTGADVMNGGAGNDQFWFARGDFVAGQWDVIEDFSETGGNGVDFLGFSGISAQELIIADDGGRCIITTTSLNFAGGIILMNFSGARTLDQLLF